MNRKRTMLWMLLLVPVAAMIGCGGDDITQSDVDRAAEEAAEKATEEAQAEQELADLRKEVRKLQRRQASGSGGSGSGGSGTGGSTSGGSGGATAPPATGPSTSGGLPSDAKSCGAGVWARSGTTSCSFALNVASDYFTTGSSRFQSASPATGQIYTMSCSGFAPVICTGGNNAAVYIP